MTATASHALSLLIRADHREINDHLHSALKEVKESPCDLVGIAVCHEMAEAFIADFPGNIEEEIRRFEQRRAVWIWEYPGARYYLCHNGEATRRDRWFFFSMFLLRLIETKKKH